MICLPACVAAALVVGGKAPTSGIVDLRSQLARRQSAEARKAVEAAVESLLPPMPQPVDSSTLTGRWKLLWSSQTADVNPFAYPDSVLGGHCFQEIELTTEGHGRVNNVVEWAPRSRLIGGAAVAPASESASRSILSIDSAVLELGGRRLDFSLSRFARLIDRTKRKRSEGEGTGADAGDLVGRGWLECLYLDADLRISRDNTGFLYIHSRESDEDDTTTSAAEAEDATEATGSGTDGAATSRLGLAGLAGGVTTATVVSTAGGVCVGGGCVAAGSVAAGAGVGAAAGATGIAGMAGGAAAALQSAVAAAALVVASVGSLLLGEGAPAPSRPLVEMVAASTPIAVASTSGKPTVTHPIPVTTYTHPLPVHHLHSPRPWCERPLPVCRGLGPALIFSRLCYPLTYNSSLPSGS